MKIIKINSSKKTKSNPSQDKNKSTVLDGCGKCHFSRQNNY